MYKDKGYGVVVLDGYREGVSLVYSLLCIVYVGFSGI